MQFQLVAASYSGVPLLVASFTYKSSVPGQLHGITEHELAIRTFQALIYSLGVHRLVAWHRGLYTLRWIINAELFLQAGLTTQSCVVLYPRYCGAELLS